MGSAAGFVLKKVAGKLIKIAGAPELGWAMAGTELVNKLVSDHEKSVCEVARRRLGCVHLEVCPAGWGTRIGDIVETAFNKRGCAFYFNGVALWHFQANLDVTALNTKPIRYNKDDQKVGYYDMATEPCRSCSPKSE